MGIDVSRQVKHQVTLKFKTYYFGMRKVCERQKIKISKIIKISHLVLTWFSQSTIIKYRNK